MPRMASSSRWMRASLSLPCCDSSWRSISMRRRASSSSKRPARAGNAAAYSNAAATSALFTRVLDVRTAVLGPRRLVVAQRHRLLLAVARGLDAAVGNAEHGHHLLYRFGAALPQREVVLAAAALVAVAFDADARIPLVRHVARVRGHQRAVLVLHRVGVVVEEHAALGKRAIGVGELVPHDALAGRRLAHAPIAGDRGELPAARDLRLVEHHFTVGGEAG